MLLKNIFSASRSNHGPSWLTWLCVSVIQCNFTVCAVTLHTPSQHKVMQCKAHSEFAVRLHFDLTVSIFKDHCDHRMTLRVDWGGNMQVYSTVLFLHDLASFLGGHLLKGRNEKHRSKYYVYFLHLFWRTINIH